MRRHVRLEEGLDSAAAAATSSQYHVWPGIVRAYYPGVASAPSAPGAPPSVDVEVGVHDVRVDTETGEAISEPWPILPKVPVGMQHFGGWAISGKLSPGDHVTLIAFDLDPTAYRATGAPSDPVDTHRHGGGYWIALPFDLTDTGRTDDPNGYTLGDPGDNLLIGQPNGTQLVLTPTGIELGGAAAGDAVALASKVDSEIADLKAAVNAMAALFNATAGPMASAPGTVTPVGATPSVASAFTKTK